MTDLSDEISVYKDNVITGFQCDNADCHANYAAITVTVKLFLLKAYHKEDGIASSLSMFNIQKIYHLHLHRNLDLPGYCMTCIISHDSAQGLNKSASKQIWIPTVFQLLRVVMCEGALL